MKKLLILVMITLMLSSACNWKTDVTSSDIPSQYKTLEFWNGGGKIAAYENVTMRVEIVTSKQIIGKDIYFYKYHIIGTNINDWIIDSEALAIKYNL